MKKDGGPAFPGKLDLVDGGDIQYPGMTLRDWFAGQALLSAGYYMRGGEGAENVAKKCYAVADAMLAARGKE